MTASPEVYEHWFKRFCDAELATGGPDPQVELTARASDHLNEIDAALFIGSFVVLYTCGAAAPLYGATKKSADVATLTDWIETHWEGLSKRRERRSVWKPSKAAVNAFSWRDWVSEEWPKVRDLPYPDVYKSINDHVKYHGRYAAMKVIEGLYQRGLVTNQQCDIRSPGAKYPRKTLAAIFPEHAEVLTSKSDSGEAVVVADRCAAELKERVGVESWFDFETLLCNFRQSLDGKYPGRSHDRELAHFRAAEDYWRKFGVELTSHFDFYGLRKQLFPASCLGELGDPPWYAAREEKEHTTREFFQKMGLK